jgi:hypothetical protein
LGRFAARAIIAIAPLVIGLALAWIIGGPRYTLGWNASLDQAGPTIQRSCDSCGPPGADEIILLVAGAYVVAGAGLVILNRTQRKASSN